MLDILNINLIELNIEKSNKEKVIKELAQLMDNENRLFDCEKYVENVLEREKLTSTGFGFGVAIPHGKSDAVKEATVAVGRIPEGVEWKALDGQPVNIVFLLAVPKESATDMHLKILAALARKLMDEEFIGLLKGSSTKEEMLDVLSGVFKSI